MVVVVVVVVVAGVVRALAVVRKGRSGEATVVNFWDGSATSMVFWLFSPRLAGLTKSVREILGKL